MGRSVMPLTNKERQAQFRQRKSESGLKEIRGIFVKPSDEAFLKKEIKKMQKKLRK